MRDQSRPPVIIPYDRLGPEALRGVIEEFVTRDGTDPVDAERKIEQVWRQLERGTVAITFDEQTRTCNIVPVDRMNCPW